MCISIAIYRNLIHITWNVELESCLPRKEAITKLMWALDRKLEAELGAFIFSAGQQLKGEKSQRKKGCWYEKKNTFIEQINLLQSSDILFFLRVLYPFFCIQSQKSFFICSSCIACIWPLFNLDMSLKLICTLNNKVLFVGIYKCKSQNVTSMNNPTAFFSLGTFLYTNAFLTFSNCIN